MITIEIALPGFLLLNFDQDLRQEENLSQGGSGIIFKGTLLNPNLIGKHGTEIVAIKYVPGKPSYFII